MKVALCWYEWYVSVWIYWVLLQILTIHGNALRLFGGQGIPPICNNWCHASDIAAVDTRRYRASRPIPWFYRTSSWAYGTRPTMAEHRTHNLSKFPFWADVLRVMPRMRVSPVLFCIQTDTSVWKRIFTYDNVLSKIITIEHVDNY